MQNGDDPILGNATSVNAIKTQVIPRAVDLGEMTVRRALPSAAGQMVGPFIFIDQMGPAEFLSEKGIDVRPHPHINLATLTYLIKGEILHRDSLGTEIAIAPGAVNWMSAGSGIVHSERSSTEKRATGQTLFGLQTWMALPKALEETTAHFIHHPEAEMPRVQAEGLDARIISGCLLGERSPLEPASATLYADVQIQQGATLPFDTEFDERAVYVLSGQLHVDGREVGPNELIIFNRGKAVQLKALQNARVMIFGGDPMDGPRHIWWNFVSSRPERIEQAKAEWAAGQFDTVPGDEEEFIPLPTDNGRPKAIFPGVES
jgi:redox-sensitive bicupin YhaK (pirin superfamily)